MTTKIIGILLAVPMFAVLVLPGFAEETSLTPTSSPTATPLVTPTPAPTPKPSETTGLVCVQTALEKRENVIISAFDVFSASSKTALQARRDALKTAWSLTEKKARRAAIKKAWNDFTAVEKAARKTLNKARLTAWNQYRKDLKSCRSQEAPVSDDYGSEGHESSL